MTSTTDLRISEMPVKTSVVDSDLVTTVEPGAAVGQKNKQVTGANFMQSAAQYRTFDTAPAAPPTGEGYIYWDSDDHTLSVTTQFNDVVLQTGQETHLRVTNKSGGNILNGQVVYISGAQGQRPTIALADASDSTKYQLIGMATHDINDNANGIVTVFGIVRNINTSAFSDGDLVYLSTTTPGGLQNTRPTQPNFAIQVGKVTYSHATEGKIHIHAGDANAAYTLNKLELDQANQKEPTGIVDQTALTIAYNEATRLITVDPTATSWDYYIAGVKYTQTAQIAPAAHANATDQYFLYIDSSNTVQFSTTAWNILTDVPIALVTYNASLAKGFVTNERHGIQMDGATHYELHYQIGTYVDSGDCIMADYTVQPGVPADADNQWSLTSGTVHDEDLPTTVAALAAAGPYTVWYRTGAGGDWEWKATLTVPFHEAGSYIQYNEWTGAIWQLTALATNNYVCYYVLKTGALSNVYQTVIIPGQAKYTTLAAAQEESLSDLNLSGLPLQEFAPLYKVIFRTNAAYGNDGKCRISETPSRLVGTRVSITAAGATSHGSLANLELAQSGVTYGHIDDQSQTIAGQKTFSNGIITGVINSTQFLEPAANTIKLEYGTTYILASAVLDVSAAVSISSAFTVQTTACTINQELNSATGNPTWQSVSTPDITISSNSIESNVGALSINANSGQNLTLQADSAGSLILTYSSATDNAMVTVDKVRFNTSDLTPAVGIGSATGWEIEYTNGAFDYGARFGAESTVLTGGSEYADAVCETMQNGSLVEAFRYDSQNKQLELQSGASLASAVKVITESGASRTLSAADRGALIVCTNGGAVTITLPQVSTEDLEDGFNCVVVRNGPTSVTFATEGADTLLSADSLTKLRTAGSQGYVVKLADGSYYLAGDLTA